MLNYVKQSLCGFNRPMSRVDCSATLRVDNLFIFVPSLPWAFPFWATGWKRTVSTGRLEMSGRESW